MKRFYKLLKTKITAFPYDNRDLSSYSFVSAQVFHNVSDSSLRNAFKGESTLYSKILFDLEDPRTVLKTICISLVALLGKQGCLKRLIDFLTDTDFSHDFTIFSQSNF